MTPFGKITSTAAALMVALCLVVSTGCSKEELTPPDAPVNVHKSSTNGTVSPGSHSSGSGITDDGDDQGDKEHSNSSKP
jgi:hypothetical protein